VGNPSSALFSGAHLLHALHSKIINHVMKRQTLRSVIYPDGVLIVQKSFINANYIFLNSSLLSPNWTLLYVCLYRYIRKQNEKKRYIL